MIKYDLEVILSKNKKLIDLSKTYMMNISDYEHGVSHVNDVLDILYKLMENLDVEFNPEVCVIAAYWHDVGRIEKSEGHEAVSAKMLSSAMLKLGYDQEMIQQCVEAVLFHKWDMNPRTVEGKIVKDADKIAWLGMQRWQDCMQNNQKLDSIVSLLPKLRNEILSFDYSKQLYDMYIVKLVQLLYYAK